MTAVTPDFESCNTLAHVDVDGAAEAARSVHSAHAIHPALHPTLRHARLLSGLGRESAAMLALHLHTVYADRGTILFNQDDPAVDLYIVSSGKVKLVRRHEDGREILIALLGPGEHFGELSLLDPGPRTATAVVVSDAWLATLDKAALGHWITQRPECALHVLRVVSRGLRRGRAQVQDVTFIDVPGRLAKQLLQLAARFGVIEGDEIRVRHDLTQIELSQLVGASRETVNKTLSKSKYAARGWIRLEPRCVVILDRDHLARRAHG